MALRREITAKIKELLRQHPQGLSITEIVRNLNINRNTAGRYLENLMVSGQVEMRQFGMAKIYRLAQRVPLSAMLSISSQLIMLLDSSMRVVYANEPLLQFLSTSQKDLYGKNIEFTSCITAFDDAFDTLKKHVRTGLTGKEWSGEVLIRNKGTIFSCRIAPAVFEEGQRGVSVLFEDITERKRTEQKVQESEREFRQLAEQSTDMIVRLARDGTCRYISPACRTILGFRPEEILGRPVKEILHPDDSSLIAKIQAQLTKEHPVTTAELRIRHRDGYYVWIEASIRAIFNNRTKALIETYSIGREITTRKLAEEALRESEERYRSFVENFQGIAYRGRMDFVPVFFHGAVEEITGYREKDFLAGKPRWDQVIHPDDLREMQKSFSDLRTCPHTSTEREYRIVRKDGRVRWIHERIQNICDETGRPAFVQGALYDVTDRKNAQEALRESEATARALINTPTDSILLLDSKGVILELNETASRRLGGQRNELIGVLVDNFLPEDLARARRSFISQILDRKKPVRFEDERNGVWYDTVVYPILSDGGEVQKIAIIARDITDRRRIVEALRKSEGKLAAMLQSITDPMSMMDENLTIIWANDPAKQYFGKDIVGRKCYEAFHRRQAPCEPYPCLALKAFRDGKMHRHETAVIDIQGQTRFFECTANVALRDENGRPTAVLEISRDITDWKLAEEALRKQSQEL